MGGGKGLDGLEMERKQYEDFSRNWMELEIFRRDGRG